MTNKNIWSLKSYSYKVLTLDDTEHTSKSAYKLSTISCLEVPLILNVRKNSLQVYTSSSHILENALFSHIQHIEQNPKGFHSTNSIRFTVTYKTYLYCRIFVIEFADEMKKSANECCQQCFCIFKSHLSSTIFTTVSQELVASSTYSNAFETEAELEGNDHSKKQPTRQITVADNPNEFYTCRGLPLRQEIESCLLDPYLPSLVSAVDNPNACYTCRGLPLRQVIERCLLDPYFPSLVNTVEEHFRSTFNPR